MKKLSSAVRQLAERHARAAGAVVKLEAEIIEMSAALVRAAEQRDALAVLLQMFNSCVDPTAIAPIAGWKGRYGERGALKLCILRCLRSVAPGSLSTVELAELVCAQFSLEFSTPVLLRAWAKNSLLRELERLKTAGTVAPCGRNINERALRWRIAPESPQGSLADLLVEANALGLSTS